jgi:hypothetical protein
MARFGARGKRIHHGVTEGTEKGEGVLRWEFELAKRVHFDAFGCIGADVAHSRGVGYSVEKEHVSLPIRGVVRDRDEDSGKIAVFRRILRDFSVFARCALRVTDAHQTGAICRGGRGLGVKTVYAVYAVYAGDWPHSGQRVGVARRS